MADGYSEGDATQGRRMGDLEEGATISLKDLTRVHEFISGELQRDRDHFDRIFKRTAWFLGVLAAVLLLAGGFFGLRTIQEAREAAKAEAARATEAEVKRLRAAVETRIDAEFRTERIQRLIETVAKERTGEELNQVVLRAVSGEVKKTIQAEHPTIQRSVQEETRKSVTSLQPMISKTVESEVGRRVDTAVKPIEQRLEAYREVADVANAAIFAKAGSRKAFNSLIRAAQSKNPEIRDLAQSSLRSVDGEHNSGLHFTRSFNQPRSYSDLLKLLSDPSPLTRQAAVDTLVSQSAAKPIEILPQLVEIAAKDDDLNVSAAAFRGINKLASEKFHVLDFDSLAKWWGENRGKYAK